MGPVSKENKHAQTSLEYLFLAVGVIIFIVLIYLLLNGGIIGKQKTQVEAGLGDFLKIGEYFLFYDNFDSGSSDQWTQRQVSWAVANREYVQNDVADAQKTTMAGSLGWVNYFADVKITFPELPSVIGTHMGGLAARVNKNNGRRYVCEMKLTKVAPSPEGKLALYRFTDWDYAASFELANSATMPLDTSVHTLGVQVNGNSILCFWDGLLQINFTDPTPFKYGEISLETRESKAIFDIVRVKYQNGPQPIGPDPTAIPTPTVSPSPTPSPTPSTGPSHKICSGASCISVAGAGVDGCSTDLDCDLIILSCSDGTLYNSCSINKPYFCPKLGNPLQLKCSSCGCPAAYPYCNPDQNCSAGIQSIWLFNANATNINFSNATAVWQTNILGNGSVEYGLDAGYGNNSGNSSYMINHSVDLQYLIPDTLYHYKLTSCNATLCNSTSDLTFKTLTPMRLYNITSGNITGDSASFSWDSNLIGSGTVSYGIGAPSPYVGSQVGYTLHHYVPIGGLLPDTAYQYRLSSCNATICNTTEVRNFTTIHPIIISNVVNNTITYSSATIWWDTDVNTNGSVEYGLTQSYGSFKNISASAKTHSVQLFGLAGDTTYHYRIHAIDNLTSNITGDYTFKTLVLPCYDGDAAYFAGVDHVTRANGTNSTGTVWDYCQSSPFGPQHVEQYCSGGPGGWLIQVIANATLCQGGAAVPDTDLIPPGGPFCSKVGFTAYNETGSYNDYCVTLAQRRVYYCLGVNMLSSVAAWACSGG